MNMKKFLYTAALLLFATVISSAQNSIKVQAPNVVGLEEQFNVTFVIAGEENPSNFSWAPGDHFQLVWGPQRGTSSSVQIINGKRLRMKESDRIESVVTTVNLLGGNAKATEDEIHIVGTGERKHRPLAPIDSFNDHRIVMMASIGALLCDGPVEIISSQAVRKSYPGFFEDYKSLGGRVLTE